MKPNPLDIFAAELLRGDKCGHAALAAVLGISMREAARLMPRDESGLVSVDMWQDALNRAGRKWRHIGANRPAPGCYGLVRLCFGRRKTTHLIAVCNDRGMIKVFDNHAMCWMARGVWEALFLPVVKAQFMSRKCWIGDVIEVEP